MEINVVKQNNYTIVALNGRLDVANSGQFERTLNEIVIDVKNVLVDCSGLDYISSSGLRVFLMFLKKLNSMKGNFFLCNLQNTIKEVFDISGFTSLFKIFPTTQEAEVAL